MYTLVYGGYSDGLYLDGDCVASATAIERAGWNWYSLIGRSDRDLTELAPRILAAVERWLNRK